MMRLFLFIFIYSLLISCTKPSLVSNFEERTASHKVIAILPAEMIFSGNKPKNMTAEMEAEISEAESKAFQTSLFNEILQKASIKGGYRVDFQPIDKTNNLLSQNSISIKAAWAKDPMELAQVLGVDAVVKTKIQKARYMSDLTPYGIQVSRDILNVLVSPGDEFVSHSKTYEVNASYQLIDGATGASLWNISAQKQADWNYPSNVAIDGINAECAKNFPYRLKP